MDGTSAATESRQWSVEGMDCAACARKVHGAVEGLGGVDDVRVSAVTGTLSLRLDQGRTTPDEIETRVRGLGYGIAAASDGAAPVATGPDRSWYRTNKGRLVLATGALLAAAWAAELWAGETVGSWPFVAACLLGLAPVARRAWAALRLGQPFTIESLMTIAAAGALVIGAPAEAAVVVFLFAVGEMLEGIAAGRARSGIQGLADLVPKTALLEVEGGTKSIPAASLRVGQVVVVRPGDRIPADGEVLSGLSAVDESPVTGESVPAVKAPGDALYAGAINHEAVLRLRVTRAAEDNTIARILRLVAEAEAARAPTERFIDRFSRVYMPVVVAFALAVALVPPLAAGGEWATWIYRALALLLIGCPCALVISVPAAMASALATGARHGLLMKGGVVIEGIAAARTVAFDKTGTLTVGRPAVTEVVPLAAERAEVLAVAAALEGGSTHPLAQAVLATATAEGIKAPTADGVAVVPGRGMTGHIDGEPVWVGAPPLAAEHAVLDDRARGEIERLANAGQTVAVVFAGDHVLGLLAMRDAPRADAAAAVAELRSLGIEPLMLTGDNARTAAAVAGELGLEARASLLPDDKVAAIRELAQRAPVMMVGDGINDAPALAAAHVGIAMGSGTDVALETADGALLRARVRDVAAKIRLARATMANVRQNVAIALGLKGVFLVTTVTGFTGLWIAILADTGATVLVTLNALRLLAFRPEAIAATSAPWPRQPPSDAKTPAPSSSCCS